MARGDRAAFWQAAELGGMEMLHATHTDPAHSRHMHETFTIGLVDYGTVINQSQGETSYLRANSVYTFNPGEVHSGYAAAHLKVSYRAFYPAEAALRALAQETGLRGAPVFHQLTLDDANSVKRLRGLHELLATSKLLLERQTATLLVFEDLMRRHMTLIAKGQPKGHEPRAVREMREYIDSHFRDNISLDELASLTGLNRGYLIRVFRRTVGLPPYTYLIFRRIEAAKKLMRLGTPLAQVALEVGFSDQSHLNLHFVRLLNVTPGCYARSHYLPR